MDYATKRCFASNFIVWRKMLVIALLLTLVAGGIVLTACSSDEDRLVGQWDRTEYQGSWSQVSQSIELFSDGTAIVWGSRTNWSVDGNRIIMGDMIGSFTLSGDTFTFTHDLGTIATYTRR